jgi:hypothetical protein
VTTSRAEDVLYGSLTDVDALEQLVRIGMPLECVPNPSMRDVVSWAIEYFDKNGQTKAPSREALVETWGQLLEDQEIELQDEDLELDDVSWAIDALKARYADWRFQAWQKEAASALAQASTADRLNVMTMEVGKLNELILSLADKTQQVEGIEGIQRSFANYQRRSETAQQHRGLAFGIPEIDQYTYGIHEGELAVLAAGPKTGKSVTLAFILLQEWKKRRHATYYTLENSVDMTYDRLVCIHLHIDHDRYRRGECTPDEVERVQTFIAERGDDLREFVHVVQPQRGQRTVQWMTRHARAIGTESLLIDQLTFMEASHRSLRGPDKITDVMHDLKDAIGGRLAIPCLLAHQINREGMREAKKSGWLEMYMLAEGSEVERTADWAFGLYASPDERAAQMIKWQTMATRRGSENKNWRAGVWRPWVNQIDALEEITEPRG